MWLMKQAKPERHYYIGGSDMAGILGLSEWSSAFDVWADKTLRAPSTFSENKYTRWGHLKEPVIADWFSTRHKVQLLESPKRAKASPEWFAGTPDRLIEFDPEFDDQCYKDPISGKMLCKTGLEIKTALAKHKLKWHIDGDVGAYKAAPVVKDAKQAENMVPLHYYVQCQHYMQLMDFDAWYLCVLLDSSDYREYRLLRDREWWQWAQETCDEFWESYVKKDRPPPADWGKAVNAHLSQLHPEPTDRVRKANRLERLMIKEIRNTSFAMKDLIDQKKQLQTEVEAAQQRLYEIDGKISPLKQEHDELINLLRERIGDDLGVSCDEGRITWTPVKGQNRRINKSWPKSTSGA